MNNLASIVALHATVSHKTARIWPSSPAIFDKLRSYANVQLERKNLIAEISTMKIGLLIFTLIIGKHSLRAYTSETPLKGLSNNIPVDLKKQDPNKVIADTPSSIQPSFNEPMRNPTRKPMAEPNVDNKVCPKQEEHAVYGTRSGKIDQEPRPDGQLKGPSGSKIDDIDAFVHDYPLEAMM